MFLRTSVLFVGPLMLLFLDFWRLPVWILACMIFYLCVMDFLDSPLVLHPLTSLRPPLQWTHFYALTFSSIRVSGRRSNHLSKSCSGYFRYTLIVLFVRNRRSLVQTLKMKDHNTFFYKIFCTGCHRMCASL